MVEVIKQKNQFSLDFILSSVGGKTISSPVDSFLGYSADNRDSRIQGSLFIPLVGEAHDAHKFVKAAVEAGAKGVLFHTWNSEWDSLKEKATFIEVGDTLKALQSLGKEWRKMLQGKVLALTGSNGKTTTKDFMGQILQDFGVTHCSHGSFNNHWGVPFTLLDTPLDAQFVVVEMGMNHAGEISQLMSIADPDLVMVTNVGRAHIGNFENGIAGISAAKEEIYESAKARASLIFNIDNEWTRKMYKKYMDRPSYTFSNQNFSADVFLKLKKQTEKGMEVEGQIGGVIGKSRLNFWGPQNIQNLAAAVAMAYLGGCTPEKIWPLLEKCHTGWGRNQWVPLKSGANLLFDAYNANPDSFTELIKNIGSLVTANKNTIAVFGEMLELGGESKNEHEKLGKLAGALPFAKCIFIGPSGEDFRSGWESSKSAIKPVILNSYKDSLDLDLQSMVDNHSLIIVKGSRGGALERIVERFDPVSFPSK